jgi:hypothetical protein
MTDRISTSQRMLTSCTLYSNQLLWAGLLTVLAGAAMLAAAQTCSANTRTILLPDGSSTRFADTQFAMKFRLGAGIAGGLLTVLSAVGLCETARANRPKSLRLACAATLAVGLATLLYFGLVHSQVASTQLVTVPDGGHMEVVTYRRRAWASHRGWYTYFETRNVWHIDYFQGTAWSNQTDLRALRAVGSTIMLGGAGAIGLGLAGWLTARKAAQRPHAPVGPSESLKGDPEVGL